jgi:hypothetical protein
MFAFLSIDTQIRSLSGALMNDWDPDYNIIQTSRTEKETKLYHYNFR